LSNSEDVLRLLYHHLHCVILTPACSDVANVEGKLSKQASMNLYTTLSLGKV